jgi:hypothetical protein
MSFRVAVLYLGAMRTSSTLVAAPSPIIRKAERCFYVCSVARIERGRENVASNAGSDTSVSSIRLVNAMVSSTPIE